MAKKTTKATKAAAKTKAPHPDDHLDHCLCDYETPAHMYTRDEDLPPTKGGIASR